MSAPAQPVSWAAALPESHTARVCGGLVLLAFVPAFGAFLVEGPTTQQRFARYAAYFKQRHAEWSGAQVPPPTAIRLLNHVMSENSLLRLVHRVEYAPHPPPTKLRSLAVLLGLVQASGALSLVFFLPPIYPALASSGPSVGGFPLLSTLLSVASCVILHLLLRHLLLDRLLRARRTALLRRPDETGQTEGHVLARAK